MQHAPDSTEHTRFNNTALVLTGGGARAAYQAGALQAIARLSRHRSRNPFPIICGTSAGAINAASLACMADNFGKAVALLANFWRNIHVGKIYRADPLGVSITGARWLTLLATGWLTRHPPHSLLDNTPLRQLLNQHIDFTGIERAIAKGALQAISISASGYTSGENINFFQATPSIQGWRRVQRIGTRCELAVSHLLASSAIPFIFPAEKIHREYFGDGSMRQLAPLSPAIHLGAERILIIGTGRPHPSRMHGDQYPPLAQIAGHALSSIFLDGLAVDIERMERTNQILAAIPPEMDQHSKLGMRKIAILNISPSRPIEQLAGEHVHSLPWPIRLLLGGIGGMSRNNSTLASYLLFEKPYTRALMKLGYTDTMARGNEIADFLGF